jgi:hypothetical protein
MDRAVLAADRVAIDRHDPARRPGGQMNRAVLAADRVANRSA